MAEVTFVVTVGTSILSNAGSRLGDPFLKELATISPEDPRQSEVEKVDVGRLVNFAVAEPERCCAELNTFVKFIKKWPHLISKCRAVFYTSDTNNGRLAARAVSKAWHAVAQQFRINCEVDVREIHGLGRDFTQSLAELAAQLVREVKCERARGRLVYVVATGGFKPESTFAVLSAYLAGATGVLYIHESFRDLVELGPLPLKLSDDLVKYAKGLIDEYTLANKLGLDVHHLEDVGLFAPDRRLAPHLMRLIEALESQCS